MNGIDDHKESIILLDQDPVISPIVITNNIINNENRNDNNDDALKRAWLSRNRKTGTTLIILKELNGLW